MNDKLILLQEKSSNKVNIFTISEEFKLIPLFNNKENTYLLFFDKVLPYFDGFELMLNDKYIIKEITQEFWDKLIKLLDLSQYEQLTKNDIIYYKKDGNYYIVQELKTDWFWLNYDLICLVSELQIKRNYRLINKVVKIILKETYNYKINTTTTSRTHFYINRKINTANQSY